MRHGTYSIVARDPPTGELGAAVQSHWFSVGSLCLAARPGIGAVATQSVVEPAYGPEALDRLAGGQTASIALAELLARDPLARMRQVAVLAGDGAPAVHTGADCIAHAGHVATADASWQANMMAADTVPEALAAAFAEAEGDLAQRLLAALEAAERTGGDVRGRQSAALLVVPAEGAAWQRTVDLRVEDHPDPLGELDRLLGLHRAYALATQADELMGEGHAAEAGDRYRGRRARPGLRRAPLLGRPRGGPRGRARGRRGAGRPRGGAPPGLEDPARAAQPRVRPGGGGGAAGAGVVRRAGEPGAKCMTTAHKAPRDETRLLDVHNSSRDDAHAQPASLPSRR